MNLTLKKVQDTYNILNQYHGTNPFILKIKDKLFKMNTTPNAFETEYIMSNYQKEPRVINKIVKIADWYGEKCRDEFNLDFTPTCMYITWYIGSLDKVYHIYAIFRKSQQAATEIFAPKKGILTDFLCDDYHLKDIDFTKYNALCGRTLYPYQEEAVKFLTSRKKAILASEMGSGKALANSTLIPTTDGFKKMGEIKVGDKVFGSDGMPHNVLNVYPQGIRDIYTVTFSDGSTCDCDMEHLWIVRRTHDRENNKWEVRTLEDLCHNMISIKNGEWEIPICRHVAMSEKKHKVDYIRFIQFLFSNDFNSANNKELREKIWGGDISQEDAYILDEYKQDTITNRYNFLTALKAELSCESTDSFHHTSIRIINDIKEIICSLGGTARIKKSQDGYSLSYNLSELCMRCIVDVQFSHREEATCIHVDSSDNSYLATKNYIVTHNTMAAIVAALEDKYKKILIISPASVKMTWKKELELFVSDDDITIVEGSKWKEKRFTIINYDILKNFYTVPTETVQKKEIDVDDNGNIINITKMKTIKSSKKSIVEAAMSNSQIFQSNFDLIIIDEAHRLSNTTSGIYKIVSDLVARSKPLGIYAITGTPITNRPINFYNILKIINAPIASDWNYYVTRYCDAKSFYKKNERNAYTALFCKSKNKKGWNNLSYNEKCELDKYLESRCKKIWVTNGASHLDELQEVVKPFYLRRLKSDFGKMVKKTIKVLNYELTSSERKEYDTVWDKFLEAKDQVSKKDANLYKSITEGILFRQWLAMAMTSRTIKLAKECIKRGQKVVIICSFDEELQILQQEFSDICVVHNGKMSIKKKEQSVERFQNDDSVKVFIGNIISAGVGITLTSGSVIIFNSITFVPGEMLQAEDRIHRLNQTKDVVVYYQVFTDTYMTKMFEMVHQKNEIINNIIVNEDAK